MSSLAILGAGAWGTALALHAVRLGHQVTLCARNPAAIGAENPRLPGFALPAALRISDSVPEGAAALVVTVPMQQLRPALAALRAPPPLLLACKGLERGTGRLPLEIAAELHPGVAAAVLTGPNFATEIASGLPAASVVAGSTDAWRRELLATLGGGNFRLYGQADAVGAQVGGAAKNVIAIAAGAVTGAGIGENARAALITRGLAEIARLAVALGGRAETVAGLSGLGDLVLTCTGPASRNFAAGFALGRGEAPDPGATVEGISTAPALLARAGDVDLPICAAVAALLAGRLDLRRAIAALMARPQKAE